jgi:hypothetical protein
MEGAEMLDLEQLIEASGLEARELIVGTTPSARHRTLLSSYLLNLWRGEDTVRALMLADLRSAIEMQSFLRAGDLLLVLRLYLEDFPGAWVKEEAEVCRSGAFACVG